MAETPPEHTYKPLAGQRIKLHDRVIIVVEVILDDYKGQEYLHTVRWRYLGGTRIWESNDFEWADLTLMGKVAPY